MTTARMCVQKVVIIILSSLFCTSYSKYPKLQLSEELYNFDIDNTTNNIFIGGKNVLLKASPALAELKRVTTGPKLDYINCLDKPDCNGTYNTDNKNKVLLIDSINKRLITCGSLKHGMCHGRNLDSLLVEISSDQYVASNSDLPAVALITSIWDKNRALYIATSWDGKYGLQPLKFLIGTKPAVSTRKIDGSDVFALSANNIFTGTSSLQFKNFYYVVKYIHGFSLGGFTYFVSVQETTESFDESQKPKVFKTFIIRLCQQDRGYLSYVELPLDCQGSNGTNFNIATSAYITKPGDYLSKSFGLQASDDVLVVAFVKTNGRWDDPVENSAICMYPVNEINTALAADQQKCMDGTYKGKKLGLSWTSHGVGFCADKALGLPTIQPDFCPPVSGQYLLRYRAKVSLRKSAIVEHDNKEVLTSVAAMPYQNHTVLFIGTVQGRLLKVSVEDGKQKVEPYSETKISSNEVRQMKLTSNYKHLVILSKHQVTKVPVEECSSFSSCSDCVKARDPFCGWCTLYKRCTQKQDCSQADAHPLRFVKSVSQCVEIASINPDKVPYGPSVLLNINVTNLPPLQGDGSSYKCFIDGKERSTSMLPNGTLRCSTPPGDQLPSITDETGDIFVDLKLFSTESQTFFVSKKLGFYSCSAVRGCRNCAEGGYKCNWCTYLGICTDDGNTQCPGEYILPIEDRSAVSKGCPSLQSDEALLVPVDIITNITVPARDLPAPKAGSTYECIVTMSGRPQRTKATRVSDTQLVCSPTKYSYPASLKRLAVKLTVTFGKSDLYVPTTFKVYLYKCWVSRTDCSTCHYEVIAEPKLKCGWCKATTSKCVVREACIGGTWIPHTSECLTTPNITKVWPLAGPVAGGTEVEIHGYDMGKSFADIVNTVMVAGHQCQPDATKYQPSKRIFCNTSVSDGPVIGPVTVTVSKIPGKSTQKFHYQDPEPQDFNPKKGPKSGGTTVTITGLKMNTGRHITVEVAGRPCLVDRFLVTDSSVPCTTSRISRRRRRASNGSTEVIISFDGFTPTGPRGSFIFTPDPTVTDIKPDKVFFGGGLKLRVTGTNLDTIQKPKIFFKYRSENGTLNTAVRDCETISSSLMICSTPEVPDLAGNVTEVTVAFIMDGVNLQSNYTTVTMIPNPSFKPFVDGVHVLKEENLILEATNLENTLRDQIHVTVGELPCNITSVDKEQLVCLAPAEKSHKSKPTDGLYVVEVKVGDLDFLIGNLKYFKAETKGIPLFVWIAVGCGAFVVVIIITCILCWCRRSRRKQKRNFKSLEVQMNNLESKVARECREAFAELQTDVTDLTSDLSTSGMPFLDFQTYALHVLFPGLDDHPVLHKNKLTLTENWEKGLRQFSQLIYNKKFLLVFIRTLEAQNTFQMKDRCNVASLLMVALQAKMEYATEILKDLLCELIRKSVAKSHPKLLLRRTECIAEKMLTNWLAFCMYNFLKNDVGEPLFMLFKAVKQQTEKGPVDAVTNEARYSLSEDKLLRQAVEFKILNVTVTYESNPPAAVVLLDCDTVSQAKEKMLDVIFKNSPYSSRPTKDDLQLEWEQSSGRVLALRDDDSQSAVEGEWRKINTLSHYQVTDNASLKLVTGQRYFYSSTDSELNKRTPLPRVGFSPGASYSPLSVVTTDGPDEGGRLWHLVKQMDYPTDRADDDRNNKFLSEIYLTRLLKTKGTLQQFVERLFHTVFMRYRRGSSLPLAVKFLFDLLDTQAKELNLSDAEVLHTWKNNSLPLRFWINIIKNPNFIFDVSKSGIVDSCLSVVAQLFMDSCSVSEHVLGKDSPSNKLLYAREIPGYRQEVERFYADLQAAPAPTPQELSKFLTDLSMAHGHEFNADQALSELHDYVRKYQDQLQDALEESELSSLASKLEHVIATISDD